MATINIGSLLNNNAVDSSYKPYPNLDSKYGPYTSTSAALTALTSTVRAIGLTVGIITNSTIVEYWFKSGITDSDLVQKIASTSSSGYNIYTVARITTDTTTNLNTLFPSAIVGDHVIDTTNGGVYIKYATASWVKLNGSILTDTAPTVTRIADANVLSYK